MDTPYPCCPSASAPSLRDCTHSGACKQAREIEQAACWGSCLRIQREFQRITVSTQRGCSATALNSRREEKPPLHHRFKFHRIVPNIPQEPSGFWRAEALRQLPVSAKSPSKLEKSTSATLVNPSSNLREMWNQTQVRQIAVREEDQDAQLPDPVDHPTRHAIRAAVPSTPATRRRPATNLIARIRRTTIATRAQSPGGAPTLPGHAASTAAKPRSAAMHPHPLHLTPPKCPALPATTRSRSPHLVVPDYNVSHVENAATKRPTAV